MSTNFNNIAKQFLNNLPVMASITKTAAIGLVKEVGQLCQQALRKETTETKLLDRDWVVLDAEEIDTTPTSTRSSPSGEPEKVSPTDLDYVEQVKSTLVALLREKDHLPEGKELVTNMSNCYLPDVEDEEDPLPPRLSDLDQKIEELIHMIQEMPDFASEELYSNFEELEKELEGSQFLNYLPKDISKRHTI